VSRDEVAIAAELYDTWNRGGTGAVANGFWHPEIEWRDDPTVPDAGLFRGRDEVRRHIEERVDVLGEFKIRLEQVVEAKTGGVLAVYEFFGAGGRSGAPFAMRIAQHLRFAGDKVIDVQDYLDPDAALGALT